MVLPVVVGVDGSEPSLHAVDWAVDEAVRHGLPLRIVHASLWERYEGAALTDTPRIDPDLVTEHALAEGVVAAAAQHARRRAPLEISTGVVPEDPVSALLREAHHATVLVTGARGKGPIRELLLGSVSLSLAARAPCPVAVIRGRPQNRETRNNRIVLGIGSDTAPAAVRFAFREAAARGCELEAIQAWHPPAHRPTAHPLLTRKPAQTPQEQATALLHHTLNSITDQYPDLTVHHTLIEGSARHTLITRSTAADLLIIGTHRRHSHPGPHPGLITHTLLHHSHCPVAIVPQPDRKTLATPD
ncbi:universal stress protein [Streptomyces sp. NPDC015127]|uniref:universal stress protein n=1 Tax=Streptomyces sp. NPDC015127 TaxID=3364939 RepID=UPI0037020D9F